MNDEKKETPEAAFMPALRVLGGLIGMLRSYADSPGMTEERLRAAMRRMAERLDESHRDLWEILVTDDPRGAA